MYTQTIVLKHVCACPYIYYVNKSIEEISQSSQKKHDYNSKNCWHFMCIVTGVSYDFKMTVSMPKSILHKFKCYCIIIH